MSEVQNMVIEANSISRGFRQGPKRVQVLQDINLRVPAGSSVAIVGASGAGKSTLLHLLGGLDKPDEGQVIVDGQSIWQMNERKRGDLRNSRMGFIYQFHHLLQEFTALENVAMPLLIRGESVAVAAGRATELLEIVGLGQRLSHKPGELSGGERQRTAVARALINRPGLLLCDEPTGSLDGARAEEVADLLFELHQQENNILIGVTHHSGMADRFERWFELREGTCVEV